jgi:hypothetical protein
MTARCCAISRDGTRLAVGDARGGLTVYEFTP